MLKHRCRKNRRISSVKANNLLLVSGVEAALGCQSFAPYIR
ncbi:hypothetical Protein YC6258_00375 [Gynuella sunshinyii YC6258]|uniref:Uncharacterized protein n=1 Tax=Gynuella sunshinyii YC6258 TaxID=1445510 RepID=A0A0C5UYN7_9GAMM|nr:hypothetical Protein YC6258_00375 [Gynuella sunshinyii YC6258]